jgi:hypothetical protein
LGLAVGNLKLLSWELRIKGSYKKCDGKRGDNKNQEKDIKTKSE